MPLLICGAYQAGGAAQALGADTLVASNVLLVPGLGTEGTDLVVDLMGHASKNEWSEVPSVSILSNTGTWDASTPFADTQSLKLASAQFVDLSLSPEFFFDNEDFTIEFWVANTTATGTADILIFNRSVVANSSGLTITRATSSSSLVAYASSVMSSTNAWDIFSGSLFGAANGLGTTGVWHHVALARTSGKFYFALDGVVSTTAASDLYISRKNVQNRISGVNGSFLGNISNLRITRGVARFTSNFTVPTAPYTLLNDPYRDNVVALFQFNGNNVNAAALPSRSPILVTEELSKYGKTSLKFAQDSRCDMFSQQTLKDTITVDAWVYPTQFTTDTRPGLISASQLFHFGLLDSKVAFVLPDASGNDTVFQSTVDVELDKWTHIACVVAGGTYTFYINGDIAGSGSIAFSGGEMGGRPITLGYHKFSDTISGRFVGFAQDLRITNAKRFTGAFLPPSKAAQAPFDVAYEYVLEHVTDTYRADNILYDYSDNNATELMYANALLFPSRRTPSTQYWSHRMYSNQDSFTTGSTLLQLGASPFTIEFWVQVESNEYDARSFISKDGANTGWTIGRSAGKLFFTYGTGSYDTTLTGTKMLHVGVWYHIAVVRNAANALVCYVDGAADITGTCAQNFSATGNLRYGCSRTATLPSSMLLSDIRISKEAVYNAAFTRPSAPLSRLATTVLLDSCTDITGASDVIAIDAAAAKTSMGGELLPIAPFKNVYDKYAGSVVFTGGSPLKILNTDAYSVLTPAALPFTIEAWVRVNDDNRKGFFHTGAATAGHFGIELGRNDIYVYNGATATVIKCTTSKGWNHVAFVRSGIGTNQFAVFVNGIRVYVGTHATTIVCPTNIVIGQAYPLASPTSQDFSDTMRDFRLSMIDRYSTPLIPVAELTSADPYWANVSLLANFNGTNATKVFTDSSSNAKTPTNSAAGVVLSTTTPKFGTASAYFTGGWVQYPASADFDFGAGDFTIELFAKIGAGTILNFGNAIRFYATTTQAYIDVTIDGNTQTFASQSNTLNTTTWYGLTLSRSNGYVTATLDNTPMFLYSWYGSVLSVDAQPKMAAYIPGAIPDGCTVTVGAKDTAATNGFTGYVDSLRITKGVARYSGKAFTPAKDLSTDRFTRLHLFKSRIPHKTSPICGGYADFQMGSGVGSQAGRTPFTPEGYWSMYTSSGGLRVANSTNFNFGTGDFSIELFAMRNLEQGNLTTADISQILDTRAAWDDTGLCLRGGTHSGIQLLSGTEILLNGSSQLGAITWNHIVVQRVSGMMSLFVNGVLEDSRKYTAAITCPGILQIGRSNVVVGASGYAGFTGFLSNLRIQKGSSAYANGESITVPTSPLVANSNTVLLTLNGPAFKDSASPSVVNSLWSSNTAGTGAGDQEMTLRSPFYTSVNADELGRIADTVAESFTSSQGASSLVISGGAACTIEGWMFVVPQSWSTPSYREILRSSGTSTACTGFSIGYGRDYSVGGNYSPRTFSFDISNKGINWGMRADDCLKEGSWNYFAIVHNPAGSPEWAIFINGKRAATLATGSAPWISGSLPSDSNLFWYNCLWTISDVARYDTALLTMEIPKTRYDDDNVFLRNDYDAPFVSNTGHIRALGNATLNTRHTRNGLPSFYLPQLDTAVADCLTLTSDGYGDNMSSYMRQADWCIEMWAKQADATAGRILWSYSNILVFNSAGFWAMKWDTTIYASTIAVSQNKDFDHVCLLRRGGALYLFINGVFATSMMASNEEEIASAIQDYQSTAMYIGCDSAITVGATTWKGWVQDIRLTVGRSRYATLFAEGTPMLQDLLNNRPALTNAPLPRLK